jgi:hypothetical protein
VSFRSLGIYKEPVLKLFNLERNFRQETRKIGELRLKQRLQKIGKYKFKKYKQLMSRTQHQRNIPTQEKVYMYKVRKDLADRRVRKNGRFLPKNKKIGESFNMSHNSDFLPEDLKRLRLNTTDSQYSANSLDSSPERFLKNVNQKIRKESLSFFEPEYAYKKRTGGMMVKL